MVFFRKFFVAAFFVALATSAQAALNICNDTSDDQSISIGYKGDVEWTSEGWWNIDPGDCVTPVGGALKKRYYYLRAEVDGGNFTGEDYFFCTTPEEYTIVGDEECEERGYAREDFIEIDTGETATDFTYRITQAFVDQAQSSEDLGLKFCNETANTQSISVGYQGDDDFTSEGWWNVEPGECVTPIGGALMTQYYYFRAEVDGGDFDGDTYFFCTTPEAYTIVGDENCEARGYDRESFREIDTGPKSKSFTYTLVSDQPGTATTDDTLGLKFCNDTTDSQSVSVGYEGDEGWTSEGWWNVEPNDCVTALTGALQKQYYYYRAEVDGGDFDGENYTFCTTPEAYTIVGDTDCEARGYDKEAFREINVGVGITSYTLTLIPPPGSGSDNTANTADERATNESAVDNMADAGAGIEFCNETPDTQSISVGYEGAEGWTSEGWWVAEPGQCVTPALDGTNRRYLYYRAEVDGGDFAGQSYFFCTSAQEYTIVGDSDCEARGYEREDFREIDTTGDSGMFTFTLVADSGAESVPEMAPVEVPSDSGTADSKGGGFDFDRQGDDEPVVEAEPEPAPEPAPEPEPEPAPEVMPEPEPEPVKPPRRGGSRGG